MELILFLVMCLAELVNVEAIQTSATISPREYIASLDPSASTVFQCDVTGANSILWIVDGFFAQRQEIRQRGISTSHQITVNLTEGRFTSNISISYSDINKNIFILCLACVIQGTDVLSSPAFFKVQGLLGPPPNLTLTMPTDLQLEQSLDEFVRILIWDEPNTLNITDIEPDISHYRICYNLSTTLTCKNTTDREFLFVNVRVNLFFTVTAVNVVGEGNGSTAMHRACDSSKAPSSESGNETVILPSSESGNETVILPTLYGETNLVHVKFSFTQTNSSGGDSNCFDVYEVWTTSKSDLITLNHGIQIPNITVDHATNTRWITLSVDSSSGLRENELYSATIHAISDHGHAQHSRSINFSTYDVQSVSVLPSNESDVFEFTCTFIRGSQAQGCRLITCQEVAMGNGTVALTQCRNIIILRDQNQSLSTQTVNGFNARLYTSIQVVEIERDGSETTHRLIPELDTNILYIDPAITVTTHTSFPTDLSSSPVNDIDGMLWPKHLTISVAVTIILIVLLLIILILLLWCRQHFKAVEPEEVVYDEPYPLDLRPKTEMQMDPCPAYGVVLSQETHAPAHP